jgi:DNA-directed RNA polymerase sigma subunit (sigma70/sigma32)
MGDQINKLLRVQHSYPTVGSRTSVDELDDALEVPHKKVENMIQVARGRFRWKNLQMMKKILSWAISSKMMKLPAG